MHFRHARQHKHVQVERWRGSWLVPDVSSGVIYMNRESKASDNRKPQLNLALEKSISGCWAMNLQRQKVSESETKGRWEGEVQSACEVSEWEIRSFMDHDSWFKCFGRNRARYICFLTFLRSEIILKTFCIPGWSEEKPLFFAVCSCKANVYFNSTKNIKLYASSEMTPSHNMFDWTDTIWPLCH